MKHREVGGYEKLRAADMRPRFELNFHAAKTHNARGLDRPLMLEKTILRMNVLFAQRNAQTTAVMAEEDQMKITKIPGLLTDISQQQSLTTNELEALENQHSSNSKRVIGLVQTLREKFPRIYAEFIDGKISPSAIELLPNDPGSQVLRELLTFQRENKELESKIFELRARARELEAVRELSETPQRDARRNELAKKHTAAMNRFFTAFDALVENASEASELEHEGAALGWFPDDKFDHAGDWSKFQARQAAFSAALTALQHRSQRAA